MMNLIILQIKKEEIIFYDIKNIVNEENFTSYEFSFNYLTQNLEIYNVVCRNLIVAKKKKPYTH